MEITLNSQNPQSVISKTTTLSEKTHSCNSLSMIGENRQLVTDEPVEFEKQPVEVQDCSKITDRFRGIYIICSNLMKEN